MGSFFIIKASIVFDNDASFGDRKEDFLVQAFVSKLAMKTFNKSVLLGTARLNIQRLHVGGMTPILNDVCDKFRAIVRANIRWGSLEISQMLERIQHLVTGDRSGGVNNQTLASILIDHRQHLHGSAIRRPIHDKIPRPDVAWIGRLHRIAHRPHAKAFLSPHPLDALAIDPPAFAAQQLMNCGFNF
jgi:hypothetical protein